MPQSSKSLTSSVRVILDFQGVLIVVAVRVACTLPNGKVMYSDSSGVGKGMSILRYECSLVVMLELLCSGSGKLMVNWLVIPIQAYQIDDSWPSG